MRKSTFTDGEIVVALQAHQQGTRVEEICRKYDISQATFYRWQAQFASLSFLEVGQVRQLKEENTRLKRLVAELNRDKQMLQEIIEQNALKPAQKRATVDRLILSYDVSARHACRLICFRRATYHAHCQHLKPEMGGIMANRKRLFLNQ